MIRAQCIAGENMPTETDTPMRTTWEPPNAVQIHVSLDDIEPAIWRRLVVPLHVTLVQLHHILQAAMGWTNSHLHQFEIGGLNYGELDMRHIVQLEELLTLKPAPKGATCIAGARCCPPEDVGGPPGYFEFLRVLLSPDPDEIEEQKHLKSWSGGNFNPERFDLVKTDEAVRGALRKRQVK